jgi:hypothetical protein
MKTVNVKIKWSALSFILGLAIFSLAISYIYLDKNIFNEKREFLPISVKTNDESKFIKESKLIFLKKITKKKIVEIDIEIAYTPYERATGLMYRRSMPDTAGMLFIYEQSKPRFFWMANTYIPLDIIYVNENMQIVTIQKNTKPLSDKPIPSYKNSMYVVEVNAGFCDKYGINIGDYINFNH